MTTALPPALTDRHRIALSLTELQKQSLRLAAAGYSSDEIARELNDGSTPDAISARIRSAREKLGGVRRAAAARLLIEAEKLAEVQMLDPGLQPLELPEADQSAHGVSAVIVGGELKEERTTFTLESHRLRSDDGGVDRNPFISALKATALGLVILVLVKPVTDGFAWAYERLAPYFATRDITNGQGRSVDECWRHDGRGDQGESSYRDRHRPNDRCDIQR